MLARTSISMPQGGGRGRIVIMHRHVDGDDVADETIGAPGGARLPEHCYRWATKPQPPGKRKTKGTSVWMGMILMTKL